jgi:Family of unknown function (DUF6049)
MTSARRPAPGVRRWLHLLLGVLLVGVTGSIGLTSGPALAAPLQTELRLTTLAPITVEAGGTLRTVGTFSTSRTLDDVVVRLEVGTTAFLSRAAITEAASTPPVTTPVFGAADELGKVRADSTRRFRIQVATDDLPFYGAGVFPLRVVAVDVQTGTVLSETSTFLPYAPEGVGVSPSRLLMFWPVIGTPPGAAADPTALGADLSAGGRLSVLTRTGAGAPATWLVDPAVLDAAATLGTPDAQGWLDSYLTGSADQDVMLLPYADPDAAAIGAADEPRMLRAARAKGDKVYRRIAGPTAPADLVWPAEGAGDQATIDVAGRAGSSLMLLDEENSPLVTPLTYTPSGRVSWPDPELELLLADPAASALVATPASTPTDVLLARQRFLAETLLHALELYDPRLLVVAPPRRWDPSPLWADELVTAVRKASWLNPVSLEEAVSPSAPTVERVDPTIPESAASRQLPTSMVDAAVQGLVDNRRLAGILSQPQRLSGPIDDALYSSISTAWRDDPVAAETAQQATLDRLAGLRSRVRIISRGGTLSDDRGTFPVTLRNQLDQAVVVRLALTSADPLRLRVDGPADPIRVGPDETVSVSVELDAVTSGRLTFDAQLQTPRGTPYDDPVTVTVDVQGFGSITLLVFGVAVALMVVAAAIRVGRRVRAARRGNA